MRSHLGIVSVLCLAAMLCVPTDSDAGRGVFIDSQQRLSNDVTMDVALADLDGDGDLDALCANSYQHVQTSRVWINDGTGHFSSGAEIYTPGADSWAVALGDLDADGDVDAILGNWGVPSKVWLNDGAGHFTDSGQDLAVLGPPWWDNPMDVALGDLDGDADLDLFVVNTLGAPNVVWLNDGTGHFTRSSQTLGSPEVRSYGVGLGDLDGDGDLDAFVTNYLSPNEVLINDGQGNFAVSAQSFVAEHSNKIALGDWDGDSDLDAYVTTPNHDVLFFNDGSGLYPQRVEVDDAHLTGYNLARGDLDGDGDLDVYLANAWDYYNQVLLNDGTGRFVERLPIEPRPRITSTAVALGDLDGDGDLDAFIGNGGPAYVLFNIGPEDQAQRILDYFDAAVAAGTLQGTGPGPVAAVRLTLMRAVLVLLREFADQQPNTVACTLASLAIGRSDGQAPPPDFVEGEAQPGLVKMLGDLRAMLGCSP